MCWGGGGGCNGETVSDAKFYFTTKIPTKSFNLLLLTESPSQTSCHFVLHGFRLRHVICCQRGRMWPVKSPEQPENTFCF